MRFGSRSFDISVPEGSPETFFRLLGFLNGGYSLQTIPSLVDLPSEAVLNVVEQLTHAGLVYDYDQRVPSELLDKQTFLASVSTMTSAFRLDMFRHPLFGELNARSDLFLATSIEYGHIIRDAGNHIKRAIEHAPPNLRSLLADYLESEKDHYLSLEHAIGVALSTAFRFDEVVPLPATEALLLKTHALANSDTLAYIACCGAFEAEHLPDTTEFKSWTPEVNDVYNVLRQHAVEDIGSAHSSIFREAVSGYGNFPSEWLTSICEAIHTYKHYFDNLNYELLRMYDYENVNPLRLKPHLPDFLFSQ